MRVIITLEVDDEYEVINSDKFIRLLIDDKYDYLSRLKFNLDHKKYKVKCKYSSHYRCIHVLKVVEEVAQFFCFDDYELIPHSTYKTPRVVIELSDDKYSSEIHNIDIYGYIDKYDEVRAKLAFTSGVIR